MSVLPEKDLRKYQRLTYQPNSLEVAEAASDLHRWQGEVSKTDSTIKLSADSKPAKRLPPVRGSKPEASGSFVSTPTNNNTTAGADDKNGMLTERSTTKHANGLKTTVVSEYPVDFAYLQHLSKTQKVKIEVLRKSMNVTSYPEPQRKNKASESILYIYYHFSGRTFLMVTINILEMCN